MSAPQRAPETSSNATPSADRTVLLPGSPVTYANRAYLREMGLRWDPAGHRWHGTTTVARVRELRSRLGLEVRAFGVLEGQGRLELPSPVRHPKGPEPPHRPRDGSRTCLESHRALPGPLDEPDDVDVTGRRFSQLEITSGLPDDSREADERAEGRQLRDTRARVKAARALVATTPGLSEILTNDWPKAAIFYARFAITECQYRYGVAAVLLGES